jgi:hypothetical protein
LDTLILVIRELFGFCFSFPNFLGDERGVVNDVGVGEKLMRGYSVLEVGVGLGCGVFYG